MSILNEEQQQALMDRLEGNAEPEQPVEAASEPVDQQDSQPEMEEEAPAEEQETEDLHHVPYSRFKSVIDTRNELRDQMVQMEEELLYYRHQQEEMARRRASAPEPQQREENYWDDYLSEEDEDSAPSAGNDPRLASIEQRLAAAEENYVMRELEVEVGSASERHGVPAEVIYDAIASDGSLSAEDVAVGYLEFVHEIEENALNRYKQEQHRAAPRVPTASAPVSTPGGARSSHSLEDAKHALLKHLQGN